MVVVQQAKEHKAAAMDFVKLLPTWLDAWHTKL
jgi:hypothetical protein